MGGFDELIQHLLYEIALTGTQGFSARQFEQTVKNYYDEKNAEASTTDHWNDDDLLFSTAPPARKTTVDDGLLDSVFGWLCRQPDVEIKDAKGPQSSSSTLNSSLAGKRIFASEDRVWQAIAGHGIDHKRIPQREFEILLAVAAHGAAGILQPHVRKLTGQDKRSVPKRTEMLAEKGYIVKEHVIGAGAKTSNLKLKRYANAQPVLSAKVSASLAGTSESASTIVYYEVWFDTTMRLLKENNNILSLADLRLHLGVNPSRYENKILRRGINRLSESGCIRCVSAILHDADGNSLISVASGKEKRAQSIQLLREPTAFDRIKWAQGDSKVNKNDEVIDYDESIDGSDTMIADGVGLMEVEDDYDDLELLQEHTPSQWTPEVPLVNLVYNIVKEAGPEGISSMDLASRLTGPMWRRPLDQVMALLTDVWPESQPLHLRHLAIVRNSNVHGKLKYFQYKTYGNFEKAVESGDATWDAVQESAKAKEKETGNELHSGLDEWGFPKISPQELLSSNSKDVQSRDGEATNQNDYIADDVSEGVGDTTENPDTVHQPSDGQQRDAFANEPRIESNADDDGVEIDKEAEAVSITQHQSPSPKARKPAKATGVKRRRSYKRREPLDTPEVTLHKKRDIPQYEYDEWDATAEKAAQLKIMLEMVASTRRGVDEDASGDAADKTSFPLEDLPQARVAQVKEDIMAREKPGIYINPPGAREQKRETQVVSRGRPRKALIAVVKTPSLRELEWFGQGRMPLPAPIAGRRRTTKIDQVYRSAESVNSVSELEEPTPKRRRVNKSTQPSATQVPSIPTDKDFSKPQQSAAEELNALKSKRGRKTKEAIARIAELERQILEGGSNPAEHYNILASRPGTKSKETLALMAKLQKQIEEYQQTTTLTQSVSTEATEPRLSSLQAMVMDIGTQQKATPSKHNGMSDTIQPPSEPPVSPQQTRGASLTAVSGRLMKTFKKGYVLAHPQEKFHHRGGGRYARGPKPPQVTNPVRYVQNKFVDAARELAQTFDKEYVLAHPQEAFHHRGGGRWVRVPKPLEVSTSKHPGLSGFNADAQDLPDVVDRSYVLAHPSETFHHRGFGRYARGPKPDNVSTSKEVVRDAVDETTRETVQAELRGPAVVMDDTPTVQQQGSSDQRRATIKAQVVTSLPDFESPPGGVEDADTGQSSSAQQKSPAEVFDAKYVEEHPEETFHHRGRGTWVRGLPPLDSKAKAAVRGPGAEAWRESRGTPTKPPKTPVAPKESLASTAVLRRSGRRGEVGEGEVVARVMERPGRLTKLPIPRRHLTALVSRGSGITKDQATSNQPAGSSPRTSLPKPPQNTGAGARADSLHVTFGQSNHAQPQQHTNHLSTPTHASSNSPWSLLRIVRPYSSTSLQPESCSKALDSFQPGTPENKTKSLRAASGASQPDHIILAFVTPHSSTEDEGYVPAVEDSMDIDQTMAEDQNSSITPAVPVQLTSTSLRTSQKVDARVGSNRGFQRQKIILDALRACDGVFPGEVEMWYVSIAAWKRLYNQKIEKLTVDNTLKSLQQSKKLKKLQFQFQGRGGHVVQRTILTEPNVDPTSIQVKKMQKKIIDCYPSYYLPPEVEVNNEIRTRVSDALARMENIHADAGEGSSTPTSARTRPADSSDEPVIVRQTQKATTLEIEQARQNGYSDVLAYRQHILDEARAKKDAYAAEYQIRQREIAAWPDKDYEDTAKETRSAVEQPPPKLPISALHRKPLSSLRPNTRARNSKPRKPRDVEGCMTLEDEARHRLRAGSLINHPTQSFHATSGTFGTCPMVPVHYMPELKTLRSRAVVVNEYKQHGLFRASSNVPNALVEILSRTRSLDERDRAQEFFQELDAVEAWEGGQEEPTDDISSNGTVFINHTLNQPHIYVEPEQIFPTTTIPAATSASRHATTLAAKGEAQKRHSAVLGAQTHITPVESRRIHKARRQYASRKTKSSGSDELLQDSDTEFVPDTAYPVPKRMARVRPDGKEIASRDRKSGAEFKDGQRLLVAVALVTTLCGGLQSERPPWNVVAHAMGFHFDGNFYRRRWDHFKRYRGSQLDKLRSRIRDNFLPAYERNEIPPIDFQNLCNTDWPTLVSWVEETILPNIESKNKSKGKSNEHLQFPGLSHTREAVESEFTIEEQTSIFHFNPDEYFTNVTEMARKHYALRYLHGNPLVTSDQNVSDDKFILRSWIRATIMTKQWHYDAETAAAKLGIFPNEMLEEVTAEMVAGRMLSQERKGRQLPGRNFVIHNDVLVQFKRWPSKPEEHQYLRTVADAWANIARHLKSNNELNLVAEASDPEYLVLTNMAAQGQIKTVAMLPPRKEEYDAPFPKLSPWGYSGYSYETKKVNPALLKAPIVYVKSTTYQSQHGLSRGIPIPREPTMRSGETGPRIPFWVDIYGNLIEDVWDMVVRSLMHLLVFRSGITALRMQECHSNKFWDWEIELALKWMEETGIAVRCGEGVEKDGMWKGGWSAGEWWYCAFAPDVATWQAPTGGEVGSQTAG